ncbi:hypothetical protein [Cellulosimicrobium sp. NPDC057127]|uniref:hypothetical protein n=1 Tax=Cellulosimicrobium sp. NPDC057127 TaxID=3346026 RepID=UPI00363B527B
MMKNDGGALGATRRMEEGREELKRVRRVGWVGNFLLAIAIVVVGAIFDSPEGAVIGYWAGVPGGIVTFRAIINRWPRLRGTPGGGPASWVAVLIFSLVAVTAVAFTLETIAVLVVGIAVWLAQYGVASSTARS